MAAALCTRQVLPRAIPVRYYDAAVGHRVRPPPICVQ